jgi:hypothetical protein
MCPIMLEQLCIVDALLQQEFLYKASQQWTADAGIPDSVACKQKCVT